MPVCLFVLPLRDGAPALRAVAGEQKSVNLLRDTTIYYILTRPTFYLKTLTLTVTVTVTVTVTLTPPYPYPFWDASR